MMILIPIGLDPRSHQSLRVRCTNGDCLKVRCGYTQSGQCTNRSYPQIDNFCQSFLVRWFEYFVLYVDSVRNLLCVSLNSAILMLSLNIAAKKGLRDKGNAYNWK